MAAKARVMIDGIAGRTVGTMMLIFTFLVLSVIVVRAQEVATLEDQGIIESSTIIGLEGGTGEAQINPENAMMRALFNRQQRLEEALFVLEDRIQKVADMAQRTDSRIARGEDPLVSLEIEQLWVQIRSLEQQNTLLRETLENAGVQVSTGSEE